MFNKRALTDINGFSGAVVFLVIRLLVFVLLPYQVFTGFGDLINFFRVAQIPGWPYLHYWVEFPPIFPFLSELVFRLTDGIEWKYAYSMAGLFSVFDAGSIFLFWELTKKKGTLNAAKKRLSIYVLILSLFPYGWWYFEPLVVFFFLLTLYYVTRNKPIHSGAAMAAGFLLKVFPVLVIIPAWLKFQRKTFIIFTGVFIVIVLAILSFLWSVSPDFTRASLASQYSKGSWETVWALVDGNPGTGNFGPLRERLDPSTAYISRGNPSKIPGIYLIAIAGIVGLCVLLRAKNKSDQGRIAIIGFAWCLLVLASPGWSPQWVLFFLPICLLVFPPRQGTILAILFILINFVEWPLLISRGRTDLVWMTILLRTIVLILLAVLFSQISLKVVKGKGKTDILLS